ncbi:WD repeat domain 87 [Balamuthia mandrillaris]
MLALRSSVSVSSFTPSFSPRILRFRRASMLVVLVFFLVMAHPHRASSYATTTDVDEATTPLVVRDISAECPYNCSGHGQCDPKTLACNCDKSWGGIGCRYPLQSYTSSSGQTLSANLTAADSWVYFLFTAPSPPKQVNFLQLQLRVTNVDKPVEVDLFALSGGPPAWPSTTAYDYASTGKALATRTLAVEQPMPGAWLFGVYVPSAPANCTLTATAFNQCPNNCSQQGTCDNTTGICTCDPGFFEADCSLALSSMISGKSYKGSLQLQEWNYYNLTVATQNELVITLTDTTATATGGVLLFTSQTQLPSLFNYDYKSSAASPTTFLQIQRPTQNAPYYIAVYSSANTQTPATYKLVANLQTLCPNDCSGAGTCDRSSGKCVCNASHSTSDCSWINATLTSGQLFTDTIEEGYWAYFNIEIESSTLLSAQVNDTKVGATGGLALYARQVHLPNFIEYDQLSYSDTQSSQALTLFDPPSGRYMFGIYAYQSTAYNFTVVSEIVCPNGCSNHGICQTDGTCQCQANWTQPDCSEFFAPITTRTNYTTTIAPGEVHYYQLNVRNANQLVFDVNATDGAYTGLQVYASPNAANPSPYVYTGAAISPSPFQRVVILGNELVMGKWNLAVFNTGGNATEYILQSVTPTICPNECSGNGICKAGVCSCFAEYTGTDCGSLNLYISTGDEASGSVASTQWNYYTTNVTGSNALLVRVREHGTYGKVWVFMQKMENGKTFPTQTVFTYANKSETDTHEIYVPSVNASGVWYIGCYGSPYLDFEHPKSNYGITVLVGCNEYKDCGTCVQDPNCGWCADNAENPSSGLCIGGTPSKPTSPRTCAAWLFSSCDIKEAQHMASYIGVIIGACVGVVVIISAVVAAYVMYRSKRWLDGPSQTAYKDPFTSLTFGVGTSNGLSSSGDGGLFSRGKSPNNSISSRTTSGRLPQQRNLVLQRSTSKRHNTKGSAEPAESYMSLPWEPQPLTTSSITGSQSSTPVTESPILQQKESPNDVSSVLLFASSSKPAMQKSEEEEKEKEEEEEEEEEEEVYLQESFENSVLLEKKNITNVQSKKNQNKAKKQSKDEDKGKSTKQLSSTKATNLTTTLPKQSKKKLRFLSSRSGHSRPDFKDESEYFGLSGYHSGED